MSLAAWTEETAAWQLEEELRDFGEREGQELWSALLRGEWSVSERRSTNGKRFLLLRKSSAHNRSRLTAMECLIATHAWKGSALKVIAIDLGMSQSTVSTHLRRALDKLGFSSRIEMMQALPVTAAA